MFFGRRLQVQALSDRNTLTLRVPVMLQPAGWQIWAMLQCRNARNENNLSMNRNQNVSGKIVALILRRADHSLSR